MKKQLYLIREFPVIMYPEEYVRQNLLKICMRYIPQTYLEVERPVHKYSKTDLKLRADGYKQISLTTIADFLARKKYFYIPEMIIDRLDFEDTKDLDHINFLQHEGNISPVSSDYSQGFYSELYNALLTVPYTPSNRKLPIEIVEDFGYGLYGFGNGSGKGGRFDLILRSFQVKSDSEEIIYR